MMALKSIFPVQNGFNAIFCYHVRILTQEQEEEPANYLDSFPHVPLRMVYKYLPVEDIVNTYSVSPRMNEIANEKGTWKDKYLTISEHGKLTDYIRIIQGCPLLRGIEISLCFSPCLHTIDLIVQEVAHDLIVQEIMENARELFYIKAEELGLRHIGLLVGRFPNLEKLHVSIPLPQLVRLLEVLQPCSSLKELHIKYDFVFDINSTDTLTDWRQSVTKLLGDSFPALANLDFTILQHFLEITDIVYILEKKRETLLNLTITWNRRISVQVLDIISQCRNLNLVVNIGKYDHMFCLDRLRLLRSVEIKFAETKDSFLSDLLSGICLPNVKVFKKISSCDSQNNTGKDILRKVICKFPKLQKLHLLNVIYKDIDDQLSMIGSLTDLQSLWLIDPQFLTDRGISHLSKCSALKELALENVRLNKYAVESIVKCPQLKCVFFTECKILPSSIVRMVTSMRHLKELRLFSCPIRFTNIILGNIKTLCDIRNIEFHHK